MKDDLEKFIAKNRDGFDDKTPPPFVLGRILEEMQPEQKEKPVGIVISFRVIRWAAAACVLLIAGAIAFLTLRHQPESTVAVVRVKPHVVQPDTSTTVIAANKPAQKSIDSVDNDLNVRKQVFVAKLKEHHPVNQQHVMYASLDNMESPASRLAAVSTEKIGQKDNYVIDALVKTLNNDPNSNVRLAALDGLAKFYQETYVRKQLTNALNQQHDPVVQIAMINLLIRMRTSGILEQLEQLVNDQNTQKPVRDCAYSGINQLQSS